MSPVNLSRRQSQVVELLSQGKTHKEIGADIGISKKTVDAHVNAVHKRLAIHTSTGVVAWHLNRRIALLEAFIERNNLGKVEHI